MGIGKGWIDFVFLGYIVTGHCEANRRDSAGLKILGRSDVHFFVCPKKRTKERAPRPLVPPLAGDPALLKADGSLKTRCAQTAQTPFSSASAMLGGATRGKGMGTQ